jgi:hypothetical protein
MLGGVEKAAEETASEQSSEIDIRILGWTISALGDDDSLEKFFEAIPGFFNSKLVKDLERDFPEDILERFWGALDGFMGRTLSSNSVTESVKSRRVIICRDIMSMIPCPFHPCTQSPSTILIKHRYPLRGYRLWHDGALIMIIMFAVCANQSCQGLPECRNAMTVGLRSLVCIWLSGA